jgi:hypothetical protein
MRYADAGNVRIAYDDEVRPLSSPRHRLADRINVHLSRI